MTHVRNKMDLSLQSSRQILLAAFFVFLMSLPVFSMAGTVSLPQTGQTTCYDKDGNVISCAGTGQDGDALRVLHGRLQGLRLMGTAR